MTTQYTPILALALPVTGELSGTWGDVVNDNITSMVEQAIAGLATINTWAGNGHTLTTADGTTSESRCAMLVLTDTGVALTGAATVICPTASKIYIVKNTSGQSATITTAAGTGVSIPNGETMFVFCDGTNVVQAVTRIASADVDFAKLKGTGAVVVTNILDEDNMASDSATALATQQSIKAYVDSQISANNDLSEILANGNTTGGTDIVVSTGDSVQVTDLTASVAVFTDASKNLVSNAITGTGNVVMSTSPTLVTPALGTPASGIMTNVTGTATALNIGGNAATATNASTVTTNANLTGAVTSVGNAASLGSFTSAQLATALTDETGTGANVFATSPTLVTPALGTPSSGIVTNLTGTASININGTVGATTPAAGSFTTVRANQKIVAGANLGGNTLTNEFILGTNRSSGQSEANLIYSNAGAGPGLEIGGATAGNVYNSVAKFTATGLAVTGTVTSTTDATLSGVRVGRGAGAIASNTAVGSGALSANTTGANNTASAVNALLSNTTGSNNTATGQGALESNTTGNFNTASGASALRSNTTGNSNTTSGVNALASNTTGNNNTASGVGALQNNTTGNENTATGLQALVFNTTGNENTATGQSALQNNTTGNFNTASGLNALYSNTTGSSNTASGLDALRSNTTGTQNTASGVDALRANTTGGNNTASGLQALFSNTTGIQNTATGVSALFSNTIGGSNVGMGNAALINNTTGGGNTALNPLNSAAVYAPVFDPTTQDNRFCMGSTAVTDAYIQVAWTIVSDARDKTNFAPVPHGLEFVKALQPTAYQFRTARDSEETNGRVRYGFKAQDVLALEGANPVIVDNEDADKLRMIDTALIPVLVKAIQEQQAIIESLTTRLTALESNP